MVESLTKEDVDAKELADPDNDKKELVDGEGADDQAGEPSKKKKKKNKKKKNKGAGEGDDVGEGEGDDNKGAPTATDSIVKTADDYEEEKKEEDDAADGEGDGQAKKKKKKKKKKAKGEGDDTAGATDQSKILGTIAPREQDNSYLRKIGSWAAGDWKQTADYSIPVSQQFPKGSFPVGEIQEHNGDSNRHRITAAEVRAKERLFESDYDDLRRAAEVHRQVRKHAQQIARPGMKIMDITNSIEATNRRLIEANGLEAGIAFPTGASLNNCAAHWTPNIGDETVLKYDDVMKIDYGSHINGLMTDCAFTVAFNPRYDNLLEAVKEGTNTGIQHAGIDARLNEIGEAIQEVIESYEVEIDQKTYKVKAIKNLCGHSMQRYKIHAGKSVPIVAGGPQTKMEEGEQFAIETFCSTGKGVVYEDNDCSHYMKDFDKGDVAIRDSKARGLLNVINREYGTLAWCRKWLEEHYPRHIMPLKRLVDAGVINAYPPLSDIKGCHTA